MIYKIENDIISIEQENLMKDEFINFLKTSDLGKQYPKEKFNERIDKLIRNISIKIVARNHEKKTVGMCFGLTDFAYWLHITDMGVSRDYCKLGIGRKMLQMTLDIAGGIDEINMFAYANKGAIPFYEKFGMLEVKDMMGLLKAKWTPFEVG